MEQSDVKPRITYRSLDNLSNFFNSIMEAVYEIKTDVDENIVIGNLETKLYNRESNLSFCQAQENREVGQSASIGKGGFSGAGILTMTTPTGNKQIYSPTVTRNYDDSNYRKNNYNRDLLGMWYMPLIYKAPHIVPERIYIGRNYPVQLILNEDKRKTEKNVLDSEKIQKTISNIGKTNGLWDDNIIMSDLLHEATASYLFNVLYENNISPNSVYVKDYYMCKSGEKIIIEKAGITLSNLLAEHIFELTDDDLFSITVQISWLFHNAKNAFNMVSYDCHPDNIMITQTKPRLRGVEVIDDYMYANQTLKDTDTISLDVTKIKGINAQGVKSIDIKYTGLLAKVIDYGLTHFKIGNTKFDNISTGFISHSFYSRYDAMTAPYGMETMYAAIHIYLTMLTYYRKFSDINGTTNNNVQYLKRLIDNYLEKMNLMFTDFTDVVKSLNYYIYDKDYEFDNQYVRNNNGQVEKRKSKGLLEKGKYFIGERNFVFIRDRTLVNTKEIPLQNLCNSILNQQYNYKKNQSSKVLMLISWDMYASGLYTKSTNRLFLDHEAMFNCVVEGKKIKLNGVPSGNDTIITTVDGKQVGIYKYCSNVDRSLKQLMPTNFYTKGIRDVLGLDLVDTNTGFLKRNILQSDLDRYKHNDDFPHYRIDIVPEDYNTNNNHEIIPHALLRGMQRYRSIIDGKSYKIDTKVALLEQVSINLFYYEPDEVKYTRVYEKTNLLDFVTDNPPIDYKYKKYYDSEQITNNQKNVKYAIFSTGYHIVPNNRSNKLTKLYHFGVSSENPDPIGYFYNTMVYNNGYVTSMNEVLPVPYPYVNDYGVLTCKNNKLSLHSYAEFLDIHNTTIDPQILKVNDNNYCIVKTKKISSPRPLLYDSAITIGACLVKNGITYLTDEKLDEDCLIKYDDIIDADNFNQILGNSFGNIKKFARQAELDNGINFIKRSQLSDTTIPCYVYSDQKTTKKYSGQEGESTFPYGNRHADSYAPVACICDTFDGKVVIVMIEGRGYYERGLTRFQLAKILPYFNVKNAYSLDGGFSCNIVMRKNNDIKYALPFPEKRNLGCIMMLDYVNDLENFVLPSIQKVTDDISNIERTKGPKMAAKALYPIISKIEQFYYVMLLSTKDQEKIKSYEEYRKTYINYFVNALRRYDPDSLPIFLNDLNNITRSSVYEDPTDNYMDVV